MFVIVTYDVNAKRVSKVMKICQKYFTHVQQSVFEGMITEGQLHRFQKEVSRKINIKEDQICIYEMGSLKYTRKEILGNTEVFSNIL